MEKQIKPIVSGFIDAPIVETDKMFGSYGDNEIKCPDGNWTKYLPKNEKQRQGFESMACTNFSSTTAVEILMTRLIEDKLMSIGNLAWLNENGYIDDSGHINFSDRFDAIMSNTSPDFGNTLKAPADAKHKYGLIPESMLPWVDTPAEYFDRNKITNEMKSMGLEFLKRFPINYEFVYPAEYSAALKVSPLANACYAWPLSVNGIYYRVENTINHAIAVIVPPPDYWHIMDSYDPFVKKLTNNYQFSGHAIRYIIREVVDNNPSTTKMLYNLKRDPKKNEEIYAFTQDGLYKRHIVNAETLKVGAGSGDKYWVWSENIEVFQATEDEFSKATELAEILLLPKDSFYEPTAIGKLSFLQKLKLLFS